MKFRGFLSALVTLMGCAVATSPIQGPAAPTAFDGKYVGTAVHSGGGSGQCSTITSVDMTIKGGQVVIHENEFNGGWKTFQGSVNEDGEVSTTFRHTQKSLQQTVDTLSGTIHDKKFGGEYVHGHWCYWAVQMGPAPAPTMPFDGDYLGVSTESLKTAGALGSECPPNGVPAPLTIRNGFVRSDEASWQGTVTSQGVLAMRNQYRTHVDGQIDGQGIIRGQGSNSAGCAITYVWSKQSG